MPAYFFRWDGTTTSTVASASYSLESIWGTTATNMWAVGFGRRHRALGRRRSRHSKRHPWRYDIRGRTGGAIWIVGDGGTTLSIDAAATHYGPAGRRDPSLYRLWEQRPEQRLGGPAISAQFVL